MKNKRRIPAVLIGSLSLALSAVAVVNTAGTASAQPLATWGQLSPPTSPSSSFAAMAPDRNGHIVMFGGNDGNGNPRDETWTWDGADWTLQHPLHSPPTTGQADMAYDAAHQTTVMFGGYDGNQITATTWLWDGTDWTEANPAHHPAARYNSGLAYDATNSNVVLFGGTPSYMTMPFNDTWTWDGTDWTDQQPQNSPSDGGDPAMAYSHQSGTVMLLTSGGSPSQTMSWDGSDWTTVLTPQAPFAAGTHLVEDENANYLALVGGQNTWYWSGLDWYDSTSIPTPDGRDGTAAAYDSVNGEVLMSGGIGSTGQYNDTWLFGYPTSASAPLNVQAIASGTSVTVSFDPPQVRGSGAITYTAAAYDTNAPSPGPYRAGSTSPIVIPNLVAGDSYTFFVFATNLAGEGQSSPETAPITISTPQPSNTGGGGIPVVPLTPLQVLPPATPATPAAAAAARPVPGYIVAGRPVTVVDGKVVPIETSASVPAPVVGSVRSGNGSGGWTVDAKGEVFTTGDARNFGSAAKVGLNSPIVGMAVTPDGGGYWLVASDGGIFAYGNATFKGSTGAIKLNQPIVGITATPDGGVYWMVASDGGVFSFGNAAFKGSTGAIKLNQPIMGIASTPDGGGYWMVASDGGVFSFGNAAFAGSLGGTPGSKVVGITPGEHTGYSIVRSVGTVASFGLS
ncbi:MAG: Esterase [Acidimicrobiia bacterium]|nr:Esterase [Acidimicrobiia bacterium]